MMYFETRTVPFSCPCNSYRETYLPIHFSHNILRHMKGSFSVLPTYKGIFMDEL